MEKNYNIKQFRELLKKAIGDRTQKEFASVAGLSHTNLNRMLNTDNNGVPALSSLEKIAQASQGRVTFHQLRHACGYETKDDNVIPKDDDTNILNVPDGAKNCVSSVMKLKSALSRLCGHAQKYGSIENMLETASLMADMPFVHFVIHDSKDYPGPGRLGAEHYVNAAYVWCELGFKVVFLFSVFYSITENGGFIFSDCAFDLSSLLSLSHEDAGKYLFRISELGDVNYTDYPIVCDIRKKYFGEAERKLLRAIFGDDMPTE